MARVAAALFLVVRAVAVFAVVVEVPLWLELLLDFGCSLAFCRLSISVHGSLDSRVSGIRFLLFRAPRPDTPAAPHLAPSMRIPIDVRSMDVRYARSDFQS